MAINYRIGDRIAYISLCRPEKHNALRDEDLLDLTAALQDVDRDDAVEIAILSGEGPSFCSGSDVKARMKAALDHGGQSRGPVDVEGILRAEKWKPLIAAVSGYCMGQGLGLAFLCDLVVATPGTQFQITEALLGVPTAGFVERMGLNALTLDAGMTGRFFSGERAYAVGLVARLADEGEHLAVAEELARQILGNPQGGIRQLVRYRRQVLEERLVKVRTSSGSYSWFDDPQAKQRIADRVGRYL